MHPYSTNSDEHTRALLYLFPVATLIAVAVLWVLSKVDLPIWFQAVVAGPSATGTVFSIYRWLDARGWRNHRIRRFMGIETPDLNGTWEVTSETLHRGEDKPKTAWEATATINQTWSRISVFVDFGLSESYSRSATIETRAEGGFPKLTYLFHNSPKPDPVRNVPIHEGVTELKLRESQGASQLIGEYYTHPKHRGNFGRVEMNRI